MVITSARPLEVGKTYDQSFFDNAPFEIDKKEYYVYTFQVLREATEEEFWAYIDKHYGDRDGFYHHGLFYDVSMD